MLKIRLDVEDLSVESFETTDPAGASRGTVRGHATDWDTCVDDSCADSCISYCGGCSGDGGPCGTGGTGGTGTGGSGTGWSREDNCVSMGWYSGCDLSCEFAC